jgi:orotate phosphoribosyltransferase
MLEVLEKRSAVRRGHFRLSSGRHSSVFVQKFRLFEHARLTQRFGEEVARLFEGRFDSVASPAVGAIVLGFAAALAAGSRMVFAEREAGALVFRRGFSFAPHERVLVVEDVVTTGASAREVVGLVRRLGGDPVGVAALIDRCDPARPAEMGAPFRALLRLPATSWDEAECRLCAAGEPLEDPGSRRAG